MPLPSPILPRGAGGRFAAPRPGEAYRNPGRGPVIGAAELEAFVEGLARGLPLAAAAKRAGRALSSFYNRRKADPDFALAWEEAMEASAGPVALRSGDGRRIVGLAKKRRLRLTPWRRQCFLDWLALTCNTRDSARRSGIDPATVYRAMKRDPAFAAAAAEALGRGFERLERLAARERREAEARRHAPIEATGRPTADFEEAMRLMRRWERPAQKRFGRPGELHRRAAMSDWEAVEALEARLEACLGAGEG